QGFGDTIQFIRYAPLVKAKGADVALMVQAELAPLMRRVMPDMQLGSRTSRSNIAMPPDEPAKGIRDRVGYHPARTDLDSR
ncbi:MAG: hypothetical protein ACKO54_10600, partial [Alphaproteobacteria bacterium]